MPYKRDGTWYTDIYLEGRRVRESLGKSGSRKAAKARERTIIQEWERRQATGRTVGEALAYWLEGDARSLKSLRETRSHAASLRPYRDMPLTEATTAAPTPAICPSGSMARELIFPNRIPTQKNAIAM